MEVILDRKAIIKELEKVAYLNVCPSYIKEALALIREQEQRIESLERRLRYLLQSKTISEYDEVDIHTKEYVKDIHSLDANIEHLTETNERLQKENDVLLLMPSVADVKADTVRKMAERLKLYYNNLSGTTSPVLTAYHIDQVAKEMLDGYAEPFGIVDGIKRRIEQDTCVACGEAVPEGRQICHSCEVREND